MCSKYVVEGIRREKLKTEPPFLQCLAPNLCLFTFQKCCKFRYYHRIIFDNSMMTLQGIKAPLPAQRQAGSPSRMAAPNSNFGDAEKGGLDGGAPTDQTTNANSGCQNCPFGGEISLAGSSTISMINWNGDVFSIPSHQLK